MPIIAADELSKIFATEKIYVVHGSEMLLRVEATDKIRSSIRRIANTDRQVIEADGQFDPLALVEAFSQHSLFSKNRLIEIQFATSKPSAKNIEAFEKLIDMPLENTTVLLIFSDAIDRTHQKSNWFQKIIQKTNLIEAKPVTKDQLLPWIKKRLAQQGQAMTEEALCYVVEKTEGNLLATKQIIEQLGLLNLRETITTENIRHCLHQNTSFSVFDLGEAWMAKNPQRTLQILESLKLEGEALTLILWVITDDIRKAIQFSQALRLQKPLQEIERTLRLWGNKKKVLPLACKRLGIKCLTHALKECANLDKQIKGFEETDPWQGLQKMLLGLATTEQI